MLPRCEERKRKEEAMRKVTKREKRGVTTSFSWKPGSLQRLIYPSFLRWMRESVGSRRKTLWPLNSFSSPAWMGNDF
ncbi:hypothetical protein CEXT_18291 [Caerostris extrusa]|uniref:Uncharacterized protein n=1 Tax=Caerostris extrusa TaxID=172846 RepID=A0AAV4W170_CAEEX|nr:hypothetical protein CEXT_18291 [Caerostris extrusa]